MVVLLDLQRWKLLKLIAKNMIMKNNNIVLTDKKINEIKKFHKISGILKKEIANSDFSQSKYSFKKIFLALSVLSAQQWGPRIEKVLINKIGFIKVKEKGRGDAFDIESNNYFEIKCSIITATNDSLNLVQIRN